MGCHGNYAVSHNQDGFIIEEHKLFLPLSDPRNHLTSVTNAPRNSM